MNWFMRKGRIMRPTIGVVALPLVAAILVAAPAFAGDDQPRSTGFLDSVLETLNLKTKVGPMPGFVETTRPSPLALKYIPTGRTHPKRAVAVETPTEVEATKQALDAAREAQLNPKPAPPKPAVGLKHAVPKPKTTKPDSAAASAN
ncbi:MAG TPA: hypothetical protein VH414_09825 [Lichenihabitans sp.]|nr:hypothetical protein [Lichenihabitans sp.]